jgi:hypothetical protein
MGKWEGRFERKWEVGGKKDEQGCGGKVRKIVEGEWQGVEVNCEGCGGESRKGV